MDIFWYIMNKVKLQLSRSANIWINIANQQIFGCIFKKTLINIKISTEIYAKSD